MVSARDAERAGIIKAGAKLVSAISNSRVPKITLITGGSYGAGNYALCGKAFDPRFIFAWATANIAVMGADQASETLFEVAVKSLERSGDKVDEAELEQLRDTVKAIEDKSGAQKLARDSALRIARLKREFSEQFQSTITEHTAQDTPQQPKPAQRDRDPKQGDLVRLKSLNREGRITRILDPKTLEVTVGSMKMRIPRTDIAEVIAIDYSGSMGATVGGQTKLALANEAAARSASRPRSRR